MTRRYAIFDTGALGDDLDVRNGGSLLTTVTDGLNINRSARATVAALSYDSFAEVILFGLSGTPIANKVSIGVATSAASLSTYTGGDEFGVGYRPAEGEIHHDGASVESVTVGALGDAIGVRFVPNGAGGGSVGFYRKPKGGVGELLAEIPLPVEMEDAPLYLSVSLGSDADPGDLSLHLNAGTRDYEHPAAGNELGWWESPLLSGARRISDVPFVSGRDDVPAYTRWEGGITAADIVEERSLHFWIWGDSASARGSSVTISYTDPTGYLTPSMGGAYRDQPATIRFVPEGGTLDEAIDLGSYVVERVEATSRLQRKIVLRDPLASFEIGLQRREIRPDADPEAAGRAWPLLIGPGFSLPLVLIDQPNRVYAIDSFGVSGIGRVRDRGNPLDPTTPDYTLSLDGQTVELANEPVGIVTADAVFSGETLPDPPSPVDLLGGIGDPFDGTIGGAITGWTRAASGGGDLPEYAGSGQVRFAQDGDTDSRITATAISVVAGTTYRWRITVHQMQARTPTSGTTELLWTQGASLFSPIASIVLPALGADIISPQTFEGFYTPTTSHGVTLYYDATNITAGLDCIISDVTWVEIPPPVADGDEDETDEAVAELAMPLEAMAREIIETRGRFNARVWDSTTAAAIDTATGYVGQGLWAREGITVRDALNELCRSYTASVCLNNAGKLAFPRLVDPEATVAVGTIAASDIIGDPPLPRWDDMRGLTRRIGVRRNEHVFTDDEFATDLDATSWRQRRKLTRQHRIICTYGGPLAPGLAHAFDAEPLDSRFLLRADGQAEIDRIGQIASVPRAFYTLRIREPRRFDLGDVVTLESDWFPTGSRKLLLVGMRDRRLAGDGEITLWGRAPWDL